MRSIYLDSNIVIAYYSIDKKEAEKKKMVHRALDVFARARDVYLCTSAWAITETANALISTKRMSADDDCACAGQVQGFVKRGTSAVLGSFCGAWDCLTPNPTMSRRLLG